MQSASRDLRGPGPGPGLGQREEASSRSPSNAGLDPRMHDALTDLHIYALVLEAEWQRLGDRLDEGANLSAQSDMAALKWVELVRRRAEMIKELQALRATTAALREVADSAGSAR